MDVHRSRFVPYPTSAISALAFTRTSDYGYKEPIPALKLAVGRADGTIEIWDPQEGSWVEETAFPGNGSSIDGLAWTREPDDADSEGRTISGQQRLFSIASSPTVTEWGLATGQPKRRSTGNFSEVWCFAAQPTSKVKQNTGDEGQPQDIVAGCGDGTLVLLSTADNDLQFKRFLARVSGKRARCMCVTYQNHDRVVAGFADSTIRIYDTRNASLLRSMSLGVSVPGAPKNALVWQVRCLPNGDIVSGDSNGEVKFWDGKTYSLTQRIDGHETDCLDLITNHDGTTMFSGSIDGKMAIYRQSKDNQGRKTWAKGSHRRIHSGEVKAMAAFDGKGMSVVVSGGSDVSPFVTPLREFGSENIRSLPSLPQEPPVASAPRARLLVSWWDKSIHIWRIAKQSHVDAAPEPQKPRKLVARINLNTKDVIRSVSISHDGKLLAASTSTEVKVFQLRKRVETDSLAARKLQVPDDLESSGARLLSFSPNGKWLAVVTPDSEIHIARFATDPNRPKHLHILPKTAELDRRHRKTIQTTAFKQYEQSINRLAFADDSSVLVASDLSGYLDSWVLEGHEDLTAAAVDVTQHDSQDGSSSSEISSHSDSSDEDTIVLFYGQHWADNPAGHLLPKLESPPLILTFRPTDESHAHALTNGNPGVHSTRHNPHAHSHELPAGQHRLFVITAMHQMYEFDVLSGRLSDWSRRNPTSALPAEFLKIRERVVGATWKKERLWMYGSSFVCMLDVSGDLDAHNIQTVSKKRRRKQKEDQRISKRRQLESGAGGKVDVDLEHQAESLQDADEEDDVDAGLQLTRLRGSGDEQEVAVNGDSSSTQTRKWWSTFKYRPILGMVPLQDELDPNNEQALEVALVERPLWGGRK